MATGVYSQGVTELSHIKSLHPHPILETMYCVSATRSGELVQPMIGDQTLFQNDRIMELLAMAATLESAKSYHMRVNLIRSTVKRYLASNAAARYSHSRRRR